LLREEQVGSVIHCAGNKAVGESCADPLLYFDNNVAGTVVLLQAMQTVGVRRLVFSSSATVYGLPEHNPVTESARLQVTNPYGRSKLMVEQVLADLCSADAGFRAAVLRYFNPVGAHASGLIGEDPRGVPNNLMPWLAQVAVGRRASVAVFGNDYPTRDGTGVRDYLHVVDLAEAHVDAIACLLRDDRSFTVNLGTGRGYSVLEVIHAFARACGREIPYTMAPRRAGDVAEIYADPTRARELLGWQTRHDLDAMCRDSWRWQSTHPHGFDDAPP
jgi:UDP-glucose 4-epimerase